MMPRSAGLTGLVASSSSTNNSPCRCSKRSIASDMRATSASASTAFCALLRAMPRKPEMNCRAKVSRPWSSSCATTAATRRSKHLPSYQCATSGSLGRHFCQVRSAALMATSVRPAHVSVIDKCGFKIARSWAICTKSPLAASSWEQRRPADRDAGAALYKSAAQGPSGRDDGDAPHGVHLEHDGVLDASALDRGHAAPTVERVGDRKDCLQGVALASSRRADEGLRAGDAVVVVEYQHHVLGGNAATVVGDGDAVGGDDDHDLGRDAVGLAIIDAVVGKLLGDHQRPIIGRVARAAVSALTDVNSVRREET